MILVKVETEFYSTANENVKHHIEEVEKKKKKSHTLQVGGFFLVALILPIQRHERDEGLLSDHFLPKLLVGKFQMDGP